MTMMVCSIVSSKAQLSVGKDPATPVNASIPMNLQIRADNGAAVTVQKNDGSFKVDANSHLVGTVTASGDINADKNINATKGQINGNNLYLGGWLGVIGPSTLTGTVIAGSDIQVNKGKVDALGVNVGTNGLTVTGNSTLVGTVTSKGLLTTEQLMVNQGYVDGYVLKAVTQGGVQTAQWQPEKAIPQTTDTWIYAEMTPAISIEVNSGFGGSNFTPQQYKTMVFDKVVYNKGNQYNPGNGAITVEKSGIYQLSSSVKKKSPVLAGKGDQTRFNMSFYVFVNDLPRVRFFLDSWDTPAAQPLASGAITLQLNAKDKVEFRILSTFGGYIVGDEGYMTFMKLSDI